MDMMLAAQYHSISVVYSTIVPYTTAENMYSISLLYIFKKSKMLYVGPGRAKTCEK
jgi:hypothetical protein